jgi:hypothetical protein
LPTIHMWWSLARIQQGWTPISSSYQATLRWLGNLQQPLMDHLPQVPTHLQWNFHVPTQVPHWLHLQGISQWLSRENEGTQLTASQIQSPF